MDIKGYYIDASDTKHSIHIKFLDKFVQKIIRVVENDNKISAYVAPTKVNYMSDTYTYFYNTKREKTIFNNAREVYLEDIHNLIIEISSVSARIKSISNCMVYFKNTLDIQIDSIHTVLIYQSNGANFRCSKMSGKSEIIRY